MSENYKWRVTFEHRVEYVLASDLEQAIDTARNRVRQEDGLLETVEFYNHGEERPWGMCYVDPRYGAKVTTTERETR